RLSNGCIESCCSSVWSPSWGRSLVATVCYFLSKPKTRDACVSIDFHTPRALIEIKAVLHFWTYWLAQDLSRFSSGKAPARQHVKCQKLHRTGSHHMGIHRLLCRVADVRCDRHPDQKRAQSQWDRIWSAHLDPSVDRRVISPAARYLDG